MTDPEFPKTTLQVRNAIAGDLQSLSWVVERLTPLLLAHANYRLGPSLRAQVDAQDLVNEAWVAALPKIGELEPRDGRYTPVLLRYLTATIYYSIGRLLRRRLRSHGQPASQRPRTLDGVPARLESVDDGILKTEMHDKVLELLDVLSARDREIVILRGIEQHSAARVGEMLDMPTHLVHSRYSRCLRRLRRDLPDSVFDELID